MNKKVQFFDPRQKMKDQNFEVFHYKDLNPADVEVHHHDFYEVYYLLGGEVSYWVDGRTYRLRVGDILLISPMELHRPMVKAGSPYERFVLWINRGFLDGLSENGLLTQCFSGPSNHLHGGSVGALFSMLVSESYGSKLGSDIYANGLFLQLMVELNRLSPIGAHSAAPSQWISSVLEKINNHYSQDLSLDSLASDLHISKYHLSHEFKRETGTSVYHYLTLKRLAAARQMLINGIPPGEVCTACGFRDYTVFYKAFKAEYGSSPMMSASGKKIRP